MDTGLHPDAIAQLDSAFQAGLADGQLVRIKLWSPDGQVLYSDQHELIGQRFPIEDDLQESLDGELTADVSHLDKAENVDERQFGELLEVYVPVQFGQEHVGAFEIYVPWTPIADQIRTNTRRLLLVLVGGPRPAVGGAVPDRGRRVATDPPRPRRARPARRREPSPRDVRSPHGAAEPAAVLRPGLAGDRRRGQGRHRRRRPAARSASLQRGERHPRTRTRRRAAPAGGAAAARCLACERHRRPARRRRVRDRARGTEHADRRRGRRPQAHRRARHAVRAGRHRHRARWQHRHRHLSRSRRRPRPAPAARRGRDVRGEGGARAVRVLLAGARHVFHRSARARRRPPQGDRRRNAHGGLPTDDRSRARRDRGSGGAAALDARDAGTDRPRRVHPARRTQRSDRPDHDLRARGGRPAVPRLAGSRPGPHGVGQPLGPRPPTAGARARGRRHAATARGLPRIACASRSRRVP